MGIRIVTDSTAYLPADLVARHGIAVVPLSVSFGDDARPETDIDLDGFYRRLAESSGLPTSSQPPAGAFEAVFRAALDAGDEVLGVFISGEMSGTCQSAHQARELALSEHPGGSVEIVDSRSNCMQLGFAVLEAARAAEGGASPAEAAAAARATLPRSRFLFTPATLEYLRRGGRIGGAAALVGSALRIRPILSVRDGHTVALARVRTQKRAVATMIEQLADDAEQAGLEELVAHHIGDEPAGRELARPSPALGGAVRPPGTGDPGRARRRPARRPWCGGLRIPDERPAPGVRSAPRVRDRTARGQPLPGSAEPGRGLG